MCGTLFDVYSIELDKCLNHTDKFERGSEDIFEFRFPPLGDILSAKIMHDNSGLTNPVRSMLHCIVFKWNFRVINFSDHQDWHLKEIEILDTKTQRSYLFECNQWLSREAAENQANNATIPYRCRFFVMNGFFHGNKRNISSDVLLAGSLCERAT